MYIVRVNFSTGVLHEYLFQRLDLGDACRKMVATAMYNGETCEVFDEAGRQANIAGKNVIAVQLVDVRAELIGNVRMGIYVREIQDRIGVPQTAEAPIAQRRDSFDDAAPVRAEPQRESIAFSS